MQTLRQLLCRRIIKCIFILVFFSFVVLHSIYEPSPIIIKWIMTTNIACHSEVESDLPTMDENFSPAPNSIFFHETSCKGGLNSRQACAIESAAKTNPERPIYVFFNSPITKFVLKRSNIISLQNYGNVKFMRLLIAKFAKGTPAQALIDNGTLNGNYWAIELTSDVMRYITLYKWSGIYLDTDMVVVRSFDSLPDNWAGRQDNLTVNSAALALSSDEIGRKVAKAAISEIKNNYRGDQWGYNGPGVITRVLQNICNTSDLLKMTPEACKGFNVYDPKYFYPIHWSDNQKYFEHGREFDSPDVYTYHFWNRLTYDLKIPKDSFYATIAKTYCPSIYEMYGDEFGT